jgi:phytoene dehydrogenase-like protein
MTPGQLFAIHPVPGTPRYRAPSRGLDVCGAAATPGGGVMGTPGRDAAREIFHDRRLRRWNDRARIVSLQRLRERP